jgi:hypothetical protein
MTEQTTEELERAEIEMLLPWYATGRLARADMERVESYLASHPQVARQLDLVRDEQEQTVVANEALGWPSPGAVDRLMAALPGTPSGGVPQRAGGLFFRRIGEFFAFPTATGVRWAAAGVAVLLAVQTATIATLVLGGGRSGTYQVASGLRAGGDSVTALVAFTDEATAPAITKLLREFRANIVDGPKSGGLYTVRLRIADRSQAETELRRLEERRDIVRAVLRSRD